MVARAVGIVLFFWSSARVHWRDRDNSVQHCLSFRVITSCFLPLVFLPAGPQLGRMTFFEAQPGLGGEGEGGGPSEGPITAHSSLVICWECPHQSSAASREEFSPLATLGHANERRLALPPSSQLPPILPRPPPNT